MDYLASFSVYLLTNTHKHTYILTQSHIIIHIQRVIDIAYKG